MNWFERITGFREATCAEARERLAVVICGNTCITL
jgi:hypothetical protein